ncbi:MAG TPA: ROK family transcriptional regulator [Bryobacteraceae bacterium]|nr:ROK family transcriptional regulator [Bryobacteraceae bacterium]
MKLPVHPLLGLAMNAPDMRSLNGIQLLNLIREHGPVSRAGLAKISGLSKPAVSEQVSRLVAFGAVLETGIGEVSEAGGKRPTLLAFHADAGRVAGIGIGATVTRIAIADLEGKILQSVEIPTAPEQPARKVIGRIERTLATLVSRSGRKLHAIGIGVPGRVDCNTGAVLESGSVFGWHDIDLRTPFQQRFGCTVSVDNDVNVGLMAELHRGAAQHATTAVLIRADTGIGSAVAIDRRIHHGSNWAAGEIGHLAANSSAPGRVSARGYLESVLGADQVARRVRSAAKRSPLLRGLLAEMSELPAVMAAAARKDVAARKLTAELSALAAIAVANQALAYDPDVVLLSGELFAVFIADIRKFLTRTVPWSPNVQSACFGEEGVQAGAVDVALVSAYDQMSRQLSTDPLQAQQAAAGA